VLFPSLVHAVPCRTVPFASLWSLWRELNPRPLPYQGSALPLSYKGLCGLLKKIRTLGSRAGGRAGDEIRTRDIQLGRLMLYQLSYSRLEPVAAPVAGFRKNGSVTEWWGEQDSNLRSCEAADLQSAPVGRLGISPWSAYGANGGTRTPDRLITNQLLYQLSYIGMYNKKGTAVRPHREGIPPDLGLQMYAIAPRHQTFGQVFDDSARSKTSDRGGCTR
jgi:hypothetical protein